MNEETNSTPWDRLLLIEADIASLKRQEAQIRQELAEGMTGFRAGDTITWTQGKRTFKGIVLAQLASGHEPPAPGNHFPYNKPQLITE